MSTDAESRAPSGPPPLTADDLARLRDWSDNDPDDTDLKRLLDMVDGYQALVRVLHGSPSAKVGWSHGAAESLVVYRRGRDSCLLTEHAPDLAALLEAALTAGQGEDTPHG